MFYPKEYKPHPELQRFVKCYWTLKSPAISGEIKKKQLLPDSGIKISFNLADPVQFKLKLSNQISVPDGCISGAITSNFWVFSKGQINRFGLQFNPGGIYPFINAPAWKLTDKIFNIKDFWQNDGVSPKLLCRIIRFRYVFEHLAGFSEESWVSTALACGYYDQSHFINDFKSFTGLSPSQFVTNIIKKNLFINWYPNIQALLEKAHQKKSDGINY